MRIRLERKRSKFVFEIIIGKGAGYIDGRTFFLAHKSDFLNWLKKHRNGILSSIHSHIDYTRMSSFEVGFTNNANVVPYVGERQ